MSGEGKRSDWPSLKPPRPSSTLLLRNCFPVRAEKIPVPQNNVSCSLDGTVGPARPPAAVRGAPAPGLRPDGTGSVGPAVGAYALRAMQVWDAKIVDRCRICTIFVLFRERRPMTDLQRSARPAVSPAARALRLQRIFARLQEGASYKDIAAEESLSRERLRQIVRAATARGGSAPDHKRMQFARLEPALRLAARGVAEGDAKAIPLLLKLLDRLDRYCEPGLFEDSPLLGDLFP